MSLRFPPRHGPSQHGCVLAWGVLFQTETLTAAECVRRIAPLIGPGDRLLGTGLMVCVQLARPRHLRAELSSGELITKQHGFLSAFALAPEEAAQLTAASGSLLWWQEGTLRVAQPTELVAYKPEQWLDLGDVAQLEVESLGAPPASLREPVAPKPIDVRETLGVAQLSDSDLATHALVTAAAQRSAGPGLLRRAVAWLRGLGLARAKPRAPARASLLSRLGALLAGGLTQLGLAWVWLRPHARYLRQLDNLFQQGDTLEALRRALPLGGAGSGGAGSGKPKPIALLPPGRRADLSLGGAQEATQVLPIDDDWQNHLRKLYERAFRELERKGDVEHAAFVLAVLLGDIPRAIQWLERHKRMRLAAQLAESHAAPVSERVRLWFLAGETRRAVALAARHGVFADAITRLEQRDPAAAKALRLLWADRSAQAGSYLEAARIAWGAEEASALVARWLESACSDEAPVAYTAWVARIARDPSQSEAAQSPLLGLLTADHDDAPSARHLLALEVLRHPRNAALDALTTPLLRSLLRDHGEQKSGLSAEQLGQLLARAPVLRADAPALVPSPLPTLRLPRVRTLDVPAHERGAMTIYDAVAVAGGRTLLALGDVGARLLGRDGRVVVHWSKEPVHALVPSPGSHVITLSGRSAVKRLGRLDLATRRQARWLDLQLFAYAPSFDGSSWYVVPDGPARLACLDALDDEAHVLWQANMEGPMLGLHVDDKSCAFVSISAAQPELWSYELPGPVLRSRRGLTLKGASRIALAGDTRIVAWITGGRLELWQAGNLVWTQGLPSSIERSGASVHSPNEPELYVEWPWLCISQPHAWGCALDVIDLGQFCHWHSVRLHAADRVNVRFGAGFLVLSDDLGRVVRIDLERGSQTLLRS